MNKDVIEVLEQVKGTLKAHDINILKVRECKDYFEIVTDEVIEKNYFVCEKGIKIGYGKTFEELRKDNEANIKKYGKEWGDGFLGIGQFHEFMTM